MPFGGFRCEVLPNHFFPLDLHRLITGITKPLRYIGEHAEDGRSATEVFHSLDGKFEVSVNTH